MADHPSPWTIVNEYSKTVIAVAAGFLAFTITFSTQLYDPKTVDHIPILLLLTWLFLVLTIGAALFAAARLAGYLQDNINGTTGFLFLSNVAYYLLVLATTSFFAFAISSVGKKDPNSDSLKAKAVAEDYIRAVDSTFGGQIRFSHLRWIDQSSKWEFSYKLQKESLQVSVDPNKMKVIEFRFIR